MSWKGNRSFRACFKSHYCSCFSWILSWKLMQNFRTQVTIFGEYKLSVIHLPWIVITSVSFEFPLNVFTVTKNFYSENIIRTCHFLSKIPRCYNSISKTQVAERIFKLSPSHAPVIYQIPWIRWIHWIHWISDPSRETPFGTRTKSVFPCTVALWTVFQRNFEPAIIWVVPLMTITSW